MWLMFLYRLWYVLFFLALFYSSVGISYAVNMHYEYCDTDINALLLLRAQEEGLDLDKTVLMPPLDNMGDNISEQLYKERARYMEHVLTGETKPIARTILVPVNLNNIHWVGLVIRLDKDNQVSRIQYIDPLGDSTSEDSIPEEIRGSLSIAYERKNYVENLLLLRQTDKTSCGALTVENLIRAAQERFDTEVAHEETTKIIRKQHVELLERFRSDLKFNFRQENNISEFGARKALSQGFRLMMLSSRSMIQRTDGKVILLYGTSTSGKTSLCKEFLNKNLSWDVEGDDISLDQFYVAMSQDIPLFKKYFPYKYHLLSRCMSDQEISLFLFHGIMHCKETASKQAMQRILDTCNQDSIIEDMIKDIEVLLAAQQDMFHRIMRLSASGVSVIVDTMDFEFFYQFKTLQNWECPIQFVLVYCPFEELARRVNARNRGALTKSSLGEYRNPVFPLLQYLTFFRLKLHPKEMLTDKLNVATLLKIVEEQTAESLQVSSIKTELSEITHKSRENLEMVFQQLGFKYPPSDDTVLGFTPIFYCDYMINTQEVSAKDAAEIITSRS